MSCRSTPPDENCDNGIEYRADARICDETPLQEPTT